MFDLLEQSIKSFATGDKAVRQFSDVNSVVIALANVFILIGFGLSIISMAVAFVQFVTSAGDPKSTEKAQTALVWSAISAVVSLSAFALKTILINIAGITFVQ
jgi:hypothetical protein